jgi:hypothetical protein
VAIGFVGLVGQIEGEGLIKDEALEDTILQLAKKVLQPKGRRLESETKMNNITVNNVTVSSRFQIGEFRGAENNRFDVKTNYLSP